MTSFESTDKFKIYFLAANEGPVEFLGVGRNFLGGSAKEVCALAARWVFPANRQLTQFPQDGQIGQPSPPLVDRPTQLFYIWILICCVNIQI